MSVGSSHTNAEPSIRTHRRRAQETEVSRSEPAVTISSAFVTTTRKGRQPTRAFTCARRHVWASCPRVLERKESYTESLSAPTALRPCAVVCDPAVPSAIL